MKVCNYQIQTPLGNIQRLGVFLDDHTVLDPNLVWRADFEREGRYFAKERADLFLPPSLTQFLKTCDEPIERLEQSCALFHFLMKLEIKHTKDGASLTISSNNITLKKPVDHIGRYVDFYSHERHINNVHLRKGVEANPAWKKKPLYFNGNTNCIIGPDEEIPWPAFTRKIDFELELGMVIGRDGKDIKTRHALNHLFGLTILNDVTARDVQKNEVLIGIGAAKSKDFCTIIGPVITTMDEFDFKEPDLLMTAQINGVECSRGRSSECHFTLAEMISHLSQSEWLLPGDVYGQGCVGSGSGFEQNKWIKSGDKIELTVEKIGTLKNTVGQQTAQLSSQG